MLLTVSIVTYHSDPNVLATTLDSLADSWASVRQSRPNEGLLLCLIDNGDGGDAAVVTNSPAIERLGAEACHLVVLAGHGNVGYGRGHNLSLAHNASEFHLILNPDVRMAPDTLGRALEFFDTHPDVGLLAPWTTNGRGAREYLCRRYPSLLDLALRGFAPAFLRRAFDRRLARYELRTETGGATPYWDPALVSGCFMLFRSAHLKTLGGFDPRYFLYFEDYDLSLRAGRDPAARNVFVPSVRIEHFGGGASRKGVHHVRMFLASARIFFSSHGWRLW